MLVEKEYCFGVRVLRKCERMAGSDVLRVAWTGVVVELDEEEDRCALSVQKVMAKRSYHGEIDEAPFILLKVGWR